MRNIKTLFIVFILLMLSVPTFAEDEITIIGINLPILRSNYPYHTLPIDFVEPKPFFNENGDLMVPAERYSRGVGIECRVYNSTNQVRLQLHARELWFTVGSNDYIYKNDAPKKEIAANEAPIAEVASRDDSANTEETADSSPTIETPTTQTLKMNSAPVLKYGVIYIPIELISEKFGDEYTWDEATNTMTVKYDRTMFYNDGGTIRVELFDVPVLSGGLVVYEYTGYSCPAVSMSSNILNSDYEEQLILMKEILLQEFDEDHVNDVMDYIDLFEDRYTFVDYKAFFNEAKNRYIAVEASHSQVRVRIFFKDLPVME